MLSRKRMLRLAEKYGPFVRFYPEGSEGDGDPTEGDPPPLSDADAAIKEAEPKVEDSPQFKGLLRDRQADRAALSHINAENAAYKQQIEERDRELEELRKPKDEIPQLTEEEAAQEITRGEFQKTLHNTLAAHGKNLLETISKALDTRDAKSSKANLQKNQAADAQTLVRTHTAKTKGIALDAKTVVDETIAYLSVNQPKLLEFLSKQPDYASLIYKLGTGESLVPSVGQRSSLRRKTILANELDQSGDDVPGGGPPSENLSAFEAICSSTEEPSEEEVATYFET